jgi:isocitrate lyase
MLRPRNDLALQTHNGEHQYDHHSLVVADATAVHGNRDTVFLTIVLLAPLHYTRS